MKAVLILLLVTASLALADDSTVGSLITREYRISPRFQQWMESAPGAPILVSSGPSKDLATFSGVTFPATASAVYIPSSRKMIIRNTPFFHRIFQQLITQSDKPNGNANPPDPKLLQALRDASYKQ